MLLDYLEVREGQNHFVSSFLFKYLKKEHQKQYKTPKTSKKEERTVTYFFCKQHYTACRDVYLFHVRKFLHFYKVCLRGNAF